MDSFPPLGRWFEIVCNSVAPSYVRYDLYLKGTISPADREELVVELCKVIARLRLGNDYQRWLSYWGNQTPIPADLKLRFQNAFWKGFVSTKSTKHGAAPVYDTTALQGYLGELFLYLVQIQLDKSRIGSCPQKPKPYSKSEGIDSLELAGDINIPTSLHYTVWECKATTDAKYLTKYESKIYGRHRYETPKSFAEAVDSLDHRLQGDATLAAFISEMIDDFYSKPPTARKRYGGCVLMSPNDVPDPAAFTNFREKFVGILADAQECRQVRLCCVDDLASLVDDVRSGIWKKLYP